MQWIAVSMACKASEANHHTEAQAALLQVALKYTPMANVWQDEHCTSDQIMHVGVLLEVRSSHRLFGGEQQLLTLIWHDMHAEAIQLKKDIQLGIYNNTTAARWLSKGAPAHTAQAFTTMREAQRVTLDKLPLWVLDTAASSIETLLKCGFSTLGELREIPRDAFISRFGQSSLNTLDEGYGLSHSHLSPHRSVAEFNLERELPFHSNRADLVSAHCNELFHALENWLKQHKAACNSIELEFACGCDFTQSIELRSAQSSDQASLWAKLLEHRLHRLRFKDDVTSVRLHCRRTTPQSNRNLTLLPDPSSHSEQWDAVCTQLQARLGDEVVLVPMTQADPRPEHGFKYTSTPEKTRSKTTDKRYSIGFHADHNSLQSSTPRPLWLLEVPQRLAINTADQPCDWKIVSGPERIAFAWWSNDACQRDYYRAINGEKRQGWIYRDLNDPNHSWFLHGYFA